MTGRSLRGPALAAGGLLFVAIVVTVVLGALPGAARERLAARGCTVGNVARTGLTFTATDLACPELSAESLCWNLPGRDVLLAGAVFDASAWATRHPGPAPPLGPPAGVRWIRTLRADGLEVRAGTLVLARDLEGSVVPLDLSGPGVTVREDAGTLHLAIERDLAGPPIEGRVRASAVWDGATARIEGEVAAGGPLTLQWPLLGPAPLPGFTARTTVRGRVFGQPDLEGVAGWPGLTVQWTLRQDEAGVLAFEALLPDTGLEAALQPLAPLAPEVARARVTGTVGGRATWRSDGRPAATFRLEGVDVDGALPPDPGLDRGRFSWPCRTAAGDATVCTSGEGTPRWTPLAAVPAAVIHAVLAAEDAAFFTHRGYDPASLQAALDADLAALRVVRGGSTLTQQLAKNLFLDGQQTLARKVRELLLAVELDRTLGKDRVLELYLNVAEWGPGIYGLGAACERYLLKEPSRVNPLEAAFLAALLPAPRTGYRRWYVEGRPDRERLADILHTMVEAGWLKPEEAAVWTAAPLSLVPPPPGDGPTGYPPTNSRM